MTPTEQAARWLADVPRFVHVGEELLREDPNGAYVHWQDLLPAVARHLAPGDELAAQATAALEGVTPGPWLIGNLESYEGDTGIAFRRVYFPTTAEDEVQEAHVRGDNCDANARFIAFARQWVPEAAARISALIATVVEAHKNGALCPIGISPESSEFCSAGTCVICQDRHLATRDAEIATLRDRLARMEGALNNIRELNMTGADENGQHWAHSDLIEQEIVDALTDGGSNG